MISGDNGIYTLQDVFFKAEEQHVRLASDFDNVCTTCLICDQHAPHLLIDSLLCRVQRLMTLGDLSLELEKAVPFVLQYGVMPSRAQLLEAGRADLVQAVKVGVYLGIMDRTWWVTHAGIR